MRSGLTLTMDVVSFKKKKRKKITPMCSTRVVIACLIS
jgi:hypothetical protein